MKIYSHPASMNSRKVLMVAHHLGVHLEVTFVDLFLRQHHEASFVAINPNRLVPALVDGDLVLWESNAILHYLAGASPGTQLWPSQIGRQADVLRWLSWEQTQFAPPCLRLSQEYVFKPFAGAPTDLPAVDVALEAFRIAGAVLNVHLRNRRFLVGDTLTLADFAVACHLTHAEAAHIPVNDHPALSRWHGEIASTTAWAACDGRLSAETT